MFVALIMKPLYSCLRFNRLRISYLSKISEIIGSDVSMLPDDYLVNILMYGNNVFNSVPNDSIINETIQFIRCRFKKLEAFS